MSDFASRVVRAGTAAVEKRAGMLCDAKVKLSGQPRDQYAMAAVAAALRLAAEERVCPADLLKAVEWIEQRALVDAARPAPAHRRLRVVTDHQRKAS